MADVGVEFANGYSHEPTVLKGNNRMRVFQEEIFGPVLAVTTFRDEAEALSIANDTMAAWVRASGPAAATVCGGCGTASRPGGRGRTATTSTRPGPPSVGTRSPASAGRTTR
jgi:Aldehyde dehydrogenase family